MKSVNCHYFFISSVFSLRDLHHLVLLPIDLQVACLILSVYFSSSASSLSSLSSASSASSASSISSPTPPTPPHPPHLPSPRCLLDCLQVT